MGRKTFWLEEKLDGERIQLHKRGNEFRFFSRFGRRVIPINANRKAKDYTYLYGTSFDDEESSLTRHLKKAFVSGCDE
jgi:DNA ligase 4